MSKVTREDIEYFLRIHDFEDYVMYSPMPAFDGQSMEDYAYSYGWEKVLDKLKRIVE